ncbi:MAG: O-antigen ligase family protein [Parvibaculum sp.]|nr:O-antigen ligase family protein [Parvibaculum sp.]
MQDTSDNVETQDRPSSNVLLYLTLALVALAPLPLGSNRPLPAAILALSTGCLIVAWGVFYGRSPQVALRRVIWPIGLFALVCFWIFLQATPVLPDSWSDPIWASASNALGGNLRGRLSVNPDETLNGLMRLMSYGGLFWLALQLTHRNASAWLAMRAIAAIGALYALYGIIIFLMGNDTILIYEKWAYKDSLSSTFVNRNSYATFAGLCLLCALTVLLEKTRLILNVPAPLRTRVIMLVEMLASKSAFTTFAVFAIAFSLIMSASRAGVASSVIGLIVLTMCQFNHKKMKWRQILVMLAIVSIVTSLAFWVGGGFLIDRLSEDDANLGSNPRTEIYSSLYAAIDSAPWTGTGFGTFADIFPAYRDMSNGPLVFWDKAHNTYLENAIELGVPMAALLNIAIGWTALFALWGVVTRRRNWQIPAVGVAATTLVGIHSLFDFSLQIPAISALYAFIMGVAVSQSWSRTG